MLAITIFMKLSSFCKPPLAWQPQAGTDWQPLDQAYELMWVCRVHINLVGLSGLRKQNKSRLLGVALANWSEVMSWPSARMHRWAPLVVFIVPLTAHVMQIIGNNCLLATLMAHWGETISVAGKAKLKLCLQVAQFWSAATAAVVLHWRESIVLSNKL